MRIAFTGGGTGGHFYPIIATAEALHDLIKEKKLLEPELYFLGPASFDDRALYENGITFIKTPAGKMRRYFSVLNIFDTIKTGWGIVETIFILYRLFPDVILSKGGYGSIPTLMAARVLGIPVIAHDSDAVPGRATVLASKFAKRIAISFDDAIQYFPEKIQDKVAMTGNPIRKELQHPARDGSKEFLELEDNVPVLLIIGGSLGAERINDTILGALPELVNRYQVIHQTGQGNVEVVTQTAKIVLDRNERRYRYKPYGFLSPLAMKMAAGATDLVIARAGGGGISEIASWGKASIIVPLKGSAQNHQHENAFAYARSGSAVVVEQDNLSPHLLISEIDRLFTNPKARNDMAEAALKFAKPNAAKDLAQAVLDVALEHET